MSIFPTTENFSQKSKSSSRPHESQTFGRTTKAVMPRPVESFFVFSSKSNYFLSERSSPLGLPNIYMSGLEETPPEISIFPLFPWITHLLLGCFTKLFLSFGYSSLCIPCPDQYKPFSCVKENFCTFIIGKSWIFLAKILDVGKFDSFTDFQS